MSLPDRQLDQHGDNEAHLRHDGHSIPKVNQRSNLLLPPSTLPNTSFIHLFNPHQHRSETLDHPFTSQIGQGSYRLVKDWLND